MDISMSVFPDQDYRDRFEHGRVQYLLLERVAIHVEHMPDPGQWLRDLAAVCLDSADALDERADSEAAS
jgi:hypothetical protein